MVYIFRIMFGRGNRPGFVEVEPMTRRRILRQHVNRKRRRSSRSIANNFFQPHTLKEFFAMPERDQEFWKDVGRIVTEVKEGASLSQSSLKYRRDPRKVRRAAPSAFRKLKNGRYAAKPIDHILRAVVIPGSKGLREVGVRHSRYSTLVGKYWNAVDRYRDTGDASALREFRGKYIIDANGKHVRLLTNLRQLDRLGSAGVLSFETLYARVA